MGLFSRKVPQDEIINNKPAEKKDEVEPVDKNDKNEFPEWSPVVTYTHAEIATDGQLYRIVLHNNDITAVLKKSGAATKVAIQSSSLEAIGLSRSDNLNFNIIVEGIGQGAVLSQIEHDDYDKGLTEVNYAGITRDMLKLQTILICGTCNTIPLFPNEIVGFHTADRKLKFVCDQCSETVGKHYPIDKISENNISYFRDAKIVKSMKEFTPTTLLTDYDGVKRPQITKVLPIDRSLIKPGEENDLRTKVEKTDLQKNLEVRVMMGDRIRTNTVEASMNNGTNTDTDIVSENSATDMNGANADSSDETQREMVGKDKAAELDKVLNELNSINDDSTNIHEIFAKDKDTKSTLQKVKQ